MDIVETAVAEAEPMLREYYADIIARYRGRPATRREIEETLVDEPSEDLLLLLARDNDTVLGCVGLRLAVPFAEVKRVYVRPEARGRGVASAMMAAVERIALAHDCRTMRLDVRDDLVEARALYAKCGYVDVEPFNDDKYVGHWLAKELSATGKPLAWNRRLDEVAHPGTNAGPTPDGSPILSTVDDNPAGPRTPSTTGSAD
ncbi:GNAT family N-acetyltransferase [Actinocrispum wychmicini]|uniref:Acetyltransferase (GNAT) family protein n=1 Tax=Actinocrispum wychmicini TaxID=1213861 RepID=A0A4R2J6A9_9PSEU|nr:GNAT family N-acetyltransferase [Actinocrispum wychmicini]TCO53042.1 acetyltransferase (GNAT) family protein [Actinocrispum wychmicini]